MATRKTLKVADLVAETNRLLARPESPVCTPASRLAWADLLTSMLFMADAYAGYRYQSSELDEHGQLLPFCDDTRRVYHLHNRLT